VNVVNVKLNNKEIKMIINILNCPGHCSECDCLEGNNIKNTIEKLNKMIDGNRTTPTTQG